MNDVAQSPVRNDEQIRGLIDQFYRTRYFRRRPEPTAVMLSTIREALAAMPARLRLFLLWGVHGKGTLGQDDHQAINYLVAFLAHLSSELSAAIDFTTVACDTHGLANRVDPTIVNAYADGIEAEFISHGWRSLRMSDLWRLAGLSMEDVEIKEREVALHGDVRRLVEFSKKYYLGTSPEEGARRYLAVRLVERPFLTTYFQGSIHVTPNEPSLRYLQPDLPEFFIWTTRRGCSAKPWFSRGQK